LASRVGLIDLIDRSVERSPCALWSDRRRNVRREGVESTPVISAIASPDPEDSFSHRRVRKPDAPVQVIVGRPIGQAFSPPEMTVGTPRPQIV
jgi:hypothetical protein